MSVRFRAVAVVVALGSFAFLVATWIARPFVGGDTPFVLDGTNAFLNCLSAHDYNACGYTGKLNYWGLMSPVGWWPLLQHVPDMITIGLGGDGHPARNRVLASLSVAGVVGSVGLGALVLRLYARAEWFWAFLAIGLTGPILAFARQTAGEMLALGLLVAFVAATLLGANPAVVGSRRSSPAGRRRRRIHSSPRSGCSVSCSGGDVPVVRSAHTSSRAPRGWPSASLRRRGSTSSDSGASSTSTTSITTCARRASGVRRS